MGRRSDAGLSDGVRTRGQSVPAAFWRTFFPPVSKSKRGGAPVVSPSPDGRARAGSLDAPLLEIIIVRQRRRLWGKVLRRVHARPPAPGSRPAVRRSRLCPELRMELVPVSLSGAPRDSRGAYSSRASRTTFPRSCARGLIVPHASPSRVGRVPPVPRHAVVGVAKGPRGPSGKIPGHTRPKWNTPDTASPLWVDIEILQSTGALR